LFADVVKLSAGYEGKTEDQAQTSTTADETEYVADNILFLAVTAATDTCICLSRLFVFISC